MGDDFCQIIQDQELIVKNEQPQRAHREQRTQRIMKNS